MQSGVFQRSQRLAIGQDHRPIEALIPWHEADSVKSEPKFQLFKLKQTDRWRLCEISHLNRFDRRRSVIDPAAACGVPNDDPYVAG
jgi:hypothetical protein